jgi:hypothetical protein
VSTQVEQPVQKASKRGRETALDMVRSLGLVVLVIVPVWFLAKAPESDEAELREVDPTSAITSFSRDVPTAPVPGDLPDGWRATSAAYDGAAGSLRVGFVTPQEQYAEYAVGTGTAVEVVRGLVGAEAERLEPLTVAGVSWQQWREPDGSISLTRSYGPATVVLGTRRATADRDELAVLLRSLTVR